MDHDWMKMNVTADTESGKHIRLVFTDQNGEEHSYILKSTNVRWLRSALKRGIKLAKMDTM